MKTNKSNSEHYFWGENCSGWHLVKSANLSVIEELMPPNTSEKRHFHKEAQQFFLILNGRAIFEIENNIFEIGKGDGIHILPNVKHRISNDHSENLEFIVISAPSTRGDRFDIME